MKRQQVKNFSNWEGNLDIDINNYLNDHPGYEIDKIVFYPPKEYNNLALVVFNINESTTYSTAKGMIE